jgi:hypothetical protein
MNTNIFQTESQSSDLSVHNLLLGAGPWSYSASITAIKPCWPTPVIPSLPSASWSLLLPVQQPQSWNQYSCVNTTCSVHWPSQTLGNVWVGWHHPRVHGCVGASQRPWSAAWPPPTVTRGTDAMPKLHKRLPVPPDHFVTVCYVPSASETVR